MSFGSNLQFMRKMHNGMTQEDLADQMGVSRQTVSKWEMDGAFPEMEKAIALSKLFNCSLDELLKTDLNSENKAYQDLRIEEVGAFRYVRYAVISEMPEEDANNHIVGWARSMGIEKPDIVGWDFPHVSQEQINVFHMHGYCAACIIPEGLLGECKDVVSQAAAKYAAITIENPFSNPFLLIPNAYRTLHRYIQVNGLKADGKKVALDCYERAYEKNGVSYMDVYIAVS